MYSNIIYIYIYISLNHFAVHLKLTHCKLTTSQLKKKNQFWEFPGGPVGKTPCSQFRGPGLDPWSGN